MEVQRFGKYGSGESEFDFLCGIIIYNELIYVSDCFNHRVQVFDVNLNFKFQFGSRGYDDGQFDCPHGLTIYNELLFVVDKYNKRIQIFDLNGKFVKIFVRNMKYSPKFIEMHLNKIYVCCHSGHVCVLNINGIIEYEFNVSNLIYGMIIVNDLLYISFFENITICNLKGKFQSKLNGIHARGMKFFNEKIYVCNKINNCVSILNLNGENIDYINGFRKPNFIDIYDGKLYVTELNNQTIAVVELFNIHDVDNVLNNVFSDILPDLLYLICEYVISNKNDNKK
jgi:outer membrane protein assembly factor BamB